MTGVEYFCSDNEVAGEVIGKEEALEAITEVVVVGGAEQGRVVEMRFW